MNPFKLENLLAFLLPLVQNSTKDELIKCMKNSFFKYADLYAAHIVVCLIYDSLTDLCLTDKTLYYLTTFIIGVTYVSSYDLEKCKVLSTFILFSILVIMASKIWEKLFFLKISMGFYTILMFGIAIYMNFDTDTMSAIRLYFNDLEKPEHRVILSLAFMNFIAYTDNIVNNRSRGNSTDGGCLSYFSWHFLGYMFNPVNVLTGPWLSLDMYERVFIHKKRIVYQAAKMWDLNRVWTIIKYCLCSLCFYVIAQCSLPIIEDISNLWWIFSIPGGQKLAEISGYSFAKVLLPKLLVFCKCLHYRFMHYAHCNLCSAALTCAGHHFYFVNRKFPVTYPSHIEFPVSLATALVSYDRQLTLFVGQHFTNRFDHMRAIYPRSDLLTLPLIYILISFGQFTFMVAVLTLYIFVHAQSNCQSAISDAFSVCVGRYPCMKEYCPHRFNRWHPVTVASKFILMTLNIIMIDYINIAIIEGNFEIIWKELYYVGHHIFIGYFLLGILIINWHPEIVQMNRTYPNLFERILTLSTSKQMFDKSTETEGSIQLIRPVDSHDIYAKKKKMKKSKK